jgi:hypothetical protein
MRLPVFKGLSPRVLRDVAELMERRTYQVGSFVFQQGDEAECLYVLISGTVRIVRQMNVPKSFAAQHRTVCPLPCIICLLSLLHSCYVPASVLVVRGISDFFPRVMSKDSKRFRELESNNPVPCRRPSACVASIIEHDCNRH